jgi:hypothetical protein
MVTHAANDRRPVPLVVDYAFKEDGIHLVRTLCSLSVVPTQKRCKFPSWQV